MHTPTHTHTHVNAHTHMGAHTNASLERLTGCGQSVHHGSLAWEGQESGSPQARCLRSSVPILTSQRVSGELLFCSLCWSSEEIDSNTGREEAASESESKHAESRGFLLLMWTVIGRCDPDSGWVFSPQGI